VTLAIPHGFLVNDPEHVPFGVAWMRGITPLRLGVLAAVCVMHAGRSIWNFDPEHFSGEMWKLLRASGRYFLFSLPLFVLVVKAEIRTARSTLRVRIAILALAVAVGALVLPVGNTAFRISEATFSLRDPGAWQFLLAYYFRGLFMGGLLSAILLFAAHGREMDRRLHRARLARVEIDRQMAESRLQLLQAQIEPHFLFNSLASVKRLYESGPGGGRELLRNLGDYLRVASRSGRQREVRLGDEIVLARSFLAIFQVRMGRRLRVRVDLPTDLESALVPPLMVGTLVENAIKHGIAPRASGGTVNLAARGRGEVLEVEVRDDGLGFRARSGNGIGLANIRARLETLYAGAGSLELAANAEGGVTATLRLPHRSAAPLPETR